MSTRREAWFACTYPSEEGETTLFVRAWSEDEAAAEAEREIGAPRGCKSRITVERRSGNPCSPSMEAPRRAAATKKPVASCG